MLYYMDDLTERMCFRTSERVNKAAGILLHQSPKDYNSLSTVVRASVINQYNMEATKNGWKSFKDL